MSVGSLQNLPRVIQQAITRTWFDDTFELNGHRMRWSWVENHLSIVVECIKCSRGAEVNLCRSNESLREAVDVAMGWCTEDYHDCAVRGKPVDGAYCDACVAPTDEVRL